MHQFDNIMNEDIYLDQPSLKEKREQMNTPREKWGSKLGFILAASGSAFGMVIFGNIRTWLVRMVAQHLL